MFSDKLRYSCDHLRLVPWMADRIGLQQSDNTRISFSVDGNEISSAEGAIECQKERRSACRQRRWLPLTEQTSWRHWRSRDALAFRLRYSHWRVQMALTSIRSDSAQFSSSHCAEFLHFDWANALNSCSVSPKAECKELSLECLWLLPGESLLSIPG